MLKTSAASNQFCVPAALALILDIHVDEAIILIKNRVGDRPIGGLYYPIILEILKAYNVPFIKTNASLPNGTFLIVVKSHVLVRIDNKYYDNQNPNGYASSFKVKNSQILAVYEIFRATNDVSICGVSVNRDGKL